MEHFRLNWIGKAEHPHFLLSLIMMEFDATEHGLETAIATELATATEHGMDTCIWLQTTPSFLHGEQRSPRMHHTRPPDIGIYIQVQIGREQYYGEYLGHGQSKTAFLLHGEMQPLHGEMQQFHGTVLKVAKNYDVEAKVFAKASKYGLSSPVLHNCLAGFRARAYHTIGDRSSGSRLGVGDAYRRRCRKDKRREKEGYCRRDATDSF